MIRTRQTVYGLSVDGDLVIGEVGAMVRLLGEEVRVSKRTEFVVDLAGVDRIDSAGVAVLDEAAETAREQGKELVFRNPKPIVKKAMATLSSRNLLVPEKPVPESFFERLGGKVYAIRGRMIDLLTLISDSCYFSVVGLFSRKGMRKGEFVNQSILIGMNAFPIVALVAYLIGFIIALQSAAQLRQFGASIFVADLVAISMTREMGPIMTAIVFAGRSGSSIASEIATMVVTEETDALKSMALNPIRYVLVPKLHAITVAMPLLTILSMAIGVFGALVVGVVYLDIGVRPFLNEVLTVLMLKDIITGLVKSVVFAWIVALTGAYYGFHVQGGSEGVGRVTTKAVVTSVFLVILADSLIGLIFYFGQGITI